MNNPPVLVTAVELESVADCASAELVVVGAGACGLVAALRAHAGGRQVVILERDESPSGSTALSSGFVPAAGTRFQKRQGIDDNCRQFEQDIQYKSAKRSEPTLTRLACQHIGSALEWLADEHGLDWIVLDDFLYPGHSVHRMHAVPEKTGEALMASLLAAVEQAAIPLVTRSRVTALYVDSTSAVTPALVKGVAVSRPDSAVETMTCDQLILACNGYGANSTLLKRHIPEIADGEYFGHPGNMGDALYWAEALGARVNHLTAYQGHGSVAHPHGILITWALMMEGGIQINSRGLRFSNEHNGYSEQAVKVLAQPDKIAWSVFDNRLHEFALGFPDYQQAVAAGAVVQAGDTATLARAMHIPDAEFHTTLNTVARCQQGLEPDEFGRDFTTKPALSTPLYAIRVTGSLFHTQGGLMIDRNARVIHDNGNVFPNLYAAGGAACGVSGPDVSGYLSGNGLLTAIAFGFVAGWHAGDQNLR